MTTTSRSEARRLVLQALYASETGGESGEDSLAEMMKAEAPPERIVTFSQALFDETRAGREWADDVISQLSRNWKLERIAVVDQIILRMAMVEIKVMPDTPVKVVLNEAIELAKLYSTAESSSFINGLLDSYIKNFPQIAGV